MQIKKSNASSVLLTALDPSHSGKYRCEVSADAPSFHTSIVTGDLEVVGKCSIHLLSATWKWHHLQKFSIGSCRTRSIIPSQSKKEIQYSLINKKTNCTTSADFQEGKIRIRKDCRFIEPSLQSICLRNEESCL